MVKKVHTKGKQTKKPADQGVNKAPNQIAKKEKKVVEEGTKSKISRRFNKLRVKNGELDKKGVVYVGHLPKGFNEKELQKFFEQFGQVPKLRVSRSKKVKSTFDSFYLDCTSKRIRIPGILR